MKLPVVTALLFGVLLSACSEPKKPAAKEEQPAPKQETKAYLPVTDYIRSEIKKVDSAVAGILKRVSRNGRQTDSVFINAVEFHKLAEEFLPNELVRENFEKSFSESSFMDQTTETLSFTYLPNETVREVKRVDVLVSPSLELDKVKSIYIEKSYTSGDTLIGKKMMWKAGTNFSIITTKSVSDKPPLVEQIKVIWDPLNY